MPAARHWLPERFASPTFHLGPIAYTVGNITDIIFLSSLIAVILYRFIRVSQDEQRAHAEITAARSVQALLIPTQLPSNKNFMLESAYLPVNGVGGDFFQVLPLKDDSLLIVVGDVSGKGLQAAMNSSTLVGALRNELSHDPATVLEHLNHVLIGAVPVQGAVPELDCAPCFATCLCARIYPSGEMTVANAGHLSPYRDGRELALPPGLPLGVIAEAQYEQITFQLNRGDRLVFHLRWRSRSNQLARRTVRLRAHTAGKPRISALHRADRAAFRPDRRYYRGIAVRGLPRRAAQQRRIRPLKLSLASEMGRDRLLHRRECRRIPLESISMSVKALYPGTFDPPTNGHIDLIQRGARLFEHLTVAILINPVKNPLFTVEERVEMLRESTGALGNVSVATFDGMMVEFARHLGATAVLRGIRAISDYEHEFQMALMNRRLAPEIETVFLQPAGQIFVHQLAHAERSLQLRRRRERPRSTECAEAPARANQRRISKCRRFLAPEANAKVPSWIVGECTGDVSIDESRHCITVSAPIDSISSRINGHLCCGPVRQGSP